MGQNFEPSEWIEKAFLLDLLLELVELVAVVGSSREGVGDDGVVLDVGEAVESGKKGEKRTPNIFDPANPLLSKTAFSFSPTLRASEIDLSLIKECF